MREIKFRVWDKDLKKMRICGDNHHDSMIFVWDQACYFNEQNGCGSSPDGDGTYDLMQYTGLKVNGEQQLFEGDIVPVKVSIHKGWKQGWIHVNRNAVVEYVEDEIRFMFVAVVEGYGRQYVPFDKSIRQSYKIIGNIYENPELLEVAG